MSELTELQKTTRAAAIEAGCDPDILDAGGHAISCRCPKCLKYWTLMMPEDMMDEWRGCCPFSDDEIGEAMVSG